MLHWMHNPKKGIKRFVEENALDKIPTVVDPAVLNIVEMAKLNGVRPSDVRNLLAGLKPEKLEKPTNNEQIIAQLLYVFHVLLDDMHFDTSEQDFLIQFAVGIGVQPAKSPQIIKDIYFMLRNEIPEDVIMKSLSAQL